MALCALVLVAAGAVGCGEEDGVAEGAIVNVYVSAPLCPSAKVELDRRGGEANGLQVRAVCLAPAEDGNGVDLAIVGANARRATEDSTSVGFIAGPSDLAARGSRNIVEAAGIVQLSGYPGWAAMKFILDAIEAGDASRARQEAFEHAGGRPG